MSSRATRAHFRTCYARRRRRWREARTTAAAAWGWAQPWEQTTAGGEDARAPHGCHDPAMAGRDEQAATTAERCHEFIKELAGTWNVSRDNARFATTLDLAFAPVLFAHVAHSVQGSAARIGDT